MTVLSTGTTPSRSLSPTRCIRSGTGLKIMSFRAQNDEFLEDGGLRMASSVLLGLKVRFPGRLRACNDEFEC